MKKQGINTYLPIDICIEALASNASFVARSFAGDPKQVKELIKAGLSHSGTAVLDIISPCVTFNNQDNTIHSYSWGKENEKPLHELEFVPARDEINVEDFDQGSTREVELHDGSVIKLKKIESDYNPTDRVNAFRILDESNRNRYLITGLIYVNPNAVNMLDLYDLPEKPMNRIDAKVLRPSRQSLDEINMQMS